ncbi:hypothetical protein [Lignipirellula cremea]|uniref:Chromosome partition protein Smc n=1 Tax=Lignipirellula cremea TaxID=2528010 RepID=A0A518E524_9BACT|nr:hypothetical protein [Lignipirellula cremea]QDU99189.1 hypothetical protein Pla8534_71020 [Lignipirellula cremea]
MKRTLIHALCLALGLAPLALVGCDEVSQRDVKNDREQLAQEKEETAETRREVQKDIADEQREVDEVRHEAMKPTIDEHDRETIIAEQRDVEEAKREGAERIAKEEQQDREAAAELRKTEAKLALQQERDAYVKNVEGKQKLNEAQIENVEERGETLEGAALDQNQAEVKELRSRQDRVDDALSDLKSAELENWKTFQPAVEEALAELNADLNGDVNPAVKVDTADGVKVKAPGLDLDIDLNNE